MNFDKYALTQKNNIFILIFLFLILSSYLVKCDLILRSPKDLQSQFISKKI